MSHISIPRSSVRSIMRTPSSRPISRLFLLFAVAVCVVSPTTEQAAFHKLKQRGGRYENRNEC